MPTKAGTPVPEDADVSLIRHLASSAGAAKSSITPSRSFALDVTGFVAADLGASTGGFTDCLLQRGASRVYAVDVGYGELNYRLRQDARVIVMDRTNARYLEALPEAGADIAVMDLSFISLALVLPAALRVTEPDAAIVALIKPQFEAGRGAVGRAAWCGPGNPPRCATIRGW